MSNNNNNNAENNNNINNNKQTIRPYYKALAKVPPAKHFTSLNTGQKAMAAPTAGGLLRSESLKEASSMTSSTASSTSSSIADPSSPPEMAPPSMMRDKQRAMSGGGGGVNPRLGQSNINSSSPLPENNSRLLNNVLDAHQHKTKLMRSQSTNGDQQQQLLQQQQQQLQLLQQGVELRRGSVDTLTDKNRAHLHQFGPQG